MSLSVTNVSLSFKQRSVLKALNFTLQASQTLAVVGPSGSGKTSLAKLITGQLSPSEGELQNDFKTLYVSQQDQFSEISGLGSTYYSKRYEFHDYENPLSVPQYLQQLLKANGLTEKPEDIGLLDTFNIRYLLDRHLLQLSNGERKRLQLVAALLKQPELLVLDQPFTGLDVASREQLTAILEQLCKEGLALVLICGRRELPAYVDTLLCLNHGQVAYIGKPDTVSLEQLPSQQLNTSISVDDLWASNTQNYEYIIRMKEVAVSMKGQAILSGINWEVKQGDCWVLLGHNGAGKSTLLSLVTADNPQGYNNDLILFDRQRGSGESIWDIKSKIGYLSPELHLYFLRGKGVLNSVPGISSEAAVYSTLSCSDVIVSGYQDEVGTVSPVTPHQREQANRWLSMVGLGALSEALFVHASLGEQRVILLLRALIKSPALLILDEPCQGMDHDQIAYFKELLDHIAASSNVTMVYVSHHKDEIPNCVDKTLILKAGKVLENSVQNV